MWGVIVELGLRPSLVDRLVKPVASRMHVTPPCTVSHRVKQGLTGGVVAAERIALSDMSVHCLHLMHMGSSHHGVQHVVGQLEKRVLVTTADSG